ncbi:MAG: PAS domain S-box protein [Melioribacteraceae bacterium]|nr:PAS domain S-box protein [Melioribacteraceae bacterium]
MKKLATFLQNYKNQLILLVFILSIIVSVAVFIYYNLEVKKLVTEKENELKTLSLLKTKIIYKNIKEGFTEAYLLSKDEVLIDLLSGNKQKLSKYLVSLKNQHNYDNIILTDTSGNIIESINNYEKLNPFLIEFIKKAVKTKKIYSTDVYNCTIHDKIQIDLVAPIIKNSKVLAVIIFSTDPMSELYPLIQSSPVRYKTFESYLIRKDSDSITVISPLKFKSNAVLNKKFSYNDKRAAIVKATKGYTGLVETVDYRNVDVVAYVNQIPHTTWYMVTKIDREELYKDLFFKTTFLIILTSILILTIFTSISFIYSYRQRNLYKSLYRAEQEFETTLRSIGDAVITTGFDGKIKFMNPIAENLTGWSLDEALNKPLSQIFNIINETTRDIVENPVNKVLKEGSIVGLANHTLLISKNGKEIPIADSGAPIKDYEGKTIGVVLVFRDQTEERAVRKKIEESEANLNALINNRTEAIWSLDKNYKLIVCNDYFKNAYKAAYNFDLKIGTDLVGILSPELKEIWKSKYDQALAGNKVSFEFDEIILGKRHYFYVYLNPIITKNEITGITALSTDITETKKLQFELEKSEERYRIISDLVSDYVFSTIVHKDGNIELDWVAGNFKEITGYTLDEYKATGGWAGHLHPDSILQDQEDMRKILNNEKVITEVKTITKNNQIVWVRIFAQPYWDKNEKRVTKIFGSLQNINEIKLSSLALQESEQKFSIAFNESPVALSIQDDENIFIDVNQAFCELTGYERNEVIGKTGTQLKLWVEHEESDKINKIFEETGSIKNYEFLFRKKSGEIRKGLISAVAIYVNGKRADIATAVDITELKEKEEKILEQLDELRRWQNLMLDREDRVIELKKEVNDLLSILGRDKKYNVN